MYRPTASAKTARSFLNRAVVAGTEALAFAADALQGFLITAGLYEQAMRENRQHDRWKRRSAWFDRARSHGLNGPQAVARRLRQIDRGSLREANGLVRS